MVILLFALGCLPDDQVLAHYDRDGDGFPHALAAEDQGYDGAIDCDDADEAVNPDAAEVCDAIDNDCDGLIDDGEAAPRTFYADADGDGHGDASASVQACSASAGLVESSDDCDDGAEAIHPGAEEVWYDGVDQDCLADDDYDADGDGDRSDDHGGADCRDDMPTVYEGAPEGWLDVGVDNDCDGSTDDQVVLDPGSMRRIAGVGDGAGFGGAMVVLPAGWMDEEPVLVISAGGYEGYRGAVYAWPASDIGASASAADAAWTWIGAEASAEYGDVLGSAIASAGDASVPVFAMSAVSKNNGRGSVYVRLSTTIHLRTANNQLGSRSCQV